MATVKIVRKKITTAAPKVAKVKKDKIVVKKSSVVKTSTIAKKVPRVVLKIEPTKPKPLAVGDHVLFVKQNVKSRASRYILTAVENKIPGIIAKVFNDVTLHIRISPTSLLSSLLEVVDSNSIVPITKLEHDKYIEEVNAKYEEKRKKEEEELKEKIIAKHVRFTERTDYELTSKPFLNTNFNFVGLGNIPLTNGKTTGAYITNHCAAVCCSLSKTNSDMRVNIPCIWMNYFGYNLDDLRAWLAFISNCEIGFTAYIAESTPILGKVYGMSKVSNNAITYPNNNYYVNPSMETYQVVIKGNKSYTMHSYMFFILLRYMYNHAYWNIPFIAMQIKAGVKDSLSFWDCLLLAHCNEPYNGYYALTNNRDGGIAMPGISNSTSMILQRLRTQGSSMNGSFTYSNIQIDTVRSLIRKKDFNGLIELVNKYKK